MPDNRQFIRVTAAILARDGKVLIARRGPGKHQENRWEFPGGKIEPGESPEQCLYRELREEFCIEARVGEHLGSNIHRYRFGVIELMAFRVAWDGSRMSLQDHREIRWAAPSELDGFDFSPADVFFAEKIRTGAIAL
jgi:8-oxo-dGTP diphosphatase